MVKVQNITHLFIKQSLIVGLGIIVASCASHESIKPQASVAKNQKPPVAGEIITKTKFKAGKAYGAASERVIRSALKPVPRGGGRAVVGKPYKINGRWYKPRHQPNYNRTGIASWYGPNFHGRKTANGEIYDQTALSAAHPTLPLPSYVRVTNISNNRSVIVRVNDRGPFHKSRIIDLSYRTAELLGTRAGGLAKVKVNYIGPARVDGQDEDYLLASYKGPGTVEPSRIAARNKLLKYAGLPEEDELVQIASVAPAPVAPPQRTILPVKTFAGHSAPAVQAPVIIANQDSALPASGDPLILKPKLLSPVEAVTATPARLIKANPKTEAGLNAYVDHDIRSQHISKIFSQLIKKDTLEWQFNDTQSQHVGVFYDRQEALHIKDQLSRFGDVTLGTQFIDGVPVTTVELESRLPFASAAVRQIVPKAVLIK